MQPEDPANRPDSFGYSDRSHRMKLLLVVMLKRHGEPFDDHRAFFVRIELVGLYLLVLIDCDFRDDGVHGLDASRRPCGAHGAHKFTERVDLSFFRHTYLSPPSDNTFLIFPSDAARILISSPSRSTAHPAHTMYPSR